MRLEFPGVLRHAALLAAAFLVAASPCLAGVLAADRCTMAGCGHDSVGETISGRGCCCGPAGAPVEPATGAQAKLPGKSLADTPATPQTGSSDPTRSCETSQVLSPPPPEGVPLYLLHASLLR